MKSTFTSLKSSERGIMELLKAPAYIAKFENLMLYPHTYSCTHTHAHSHTHSHTTHSTFPS